MVDCCPGVLQSTRFALKIYARLLSCSPSQADRSPDVMSDVTSAHNLSVNHVVMN